MQIWISGGGYSATSDLDLGKKLEVSIPGGGVFCNFRFGLREKVGSFNSGGGGVFCNFRFGLREKVGSLDFGRGVFCNLRFGLREKVGSLDFGGGGGILQLQIWT